MCKTFRALLRSPLSELSQKVFGGCRYLVSRLANCITWCWRKRRRRLGCYTLVLFWWAWDKCLCVWKSSIKLHVEKTVRESFAWNFAYKATYPIRLCWMLGTSLKTKPEHISCSNQHTYICIRELLLLLLLLATTNKIHIIIEFHNSQLSFRTVLKV